MTLEPREVDTRIATLKRVAPDLLEIHYKVGHVFDPDGLAVVQETRRKMMGGASYATLTFIPLDMDFTLDTMRIDHAGPDRSEGQILATAIVTEANMIERLIQVYFKYFPQLHRILVTDKEDEARAWITAQLAEIASTGS